MITHCTSPYRRSFDSSRTIRPRGAVLLPAIAVVCLLALIGGSAYYLIRVLPSGSAVDTQSPEWDVATRRDIEIKVASVGALVAKDQYDLLNIIEHRDDPVIESVIAEGTWVQEGDWLVTLSAPSVISERDEMESRVREQEAEVEETRRNLAIEKDTLAAAEAKAQLAVELAQLAFDQWESGTVPQKELELQLEEEKAQRELDQAQRELELSKELYEQKFISRTELEQDEIRLIEAENALQTAKLSIEVYQAYERVMEEKTLRSDIEEAEADLSRTLRKNENQLELLNARIDNEVNELDQRNFRLERMQRMANAVELKAPRSGLVIYGSTIGSGYDRRIPIRQGARVWGGRRILVITDTTHLRARVNVHESRIRDVRAGQQVDVRLVARPNLLLTGTVLSKSNSANVENAGNPALAEYSVLVELPPDDGEHELKPGMSCNAEIAIRTIPDALALPIQAVHTEGEEHFVYVPAERGKVRRQVIEVGKASDTLVEVLGGIDEGQSVLLRNPQPGEVL